jgi:hypothetical protein
MPSERTEIQSDEQSRQAQQLSLQRSKPPAEVAGYDTERFLGAGAYGEVWVAVDHNTGRRVAIKFYTHRGGLDWSLLSREVEKLVFLSADRYVVQLLDVGWDADPPHYVMEYLEQGSLDDRIRSQGKLPVHEAVAIFRDVAIGLLHAHGKGVLHCDLKPANLLLDQDGKPRLADFGQSRLSHEQAPALGTLFYMAPEQADLSAMPDARWDVYALGALLYTMLAGTPPHQSDAATTEIETASNLEERLARYRRYIEKQPAPNRHRQVAGMDRGLADIVDRCLLADPELRYPNVQAVHEALERRDARHARRPLLVMGMLGPVLLLMVTALAAWWALQTVVSQADSALTGKSLESKLFAAQLAAKAVASDLDLSFRAVEQVAEDGKLRALLAAVVADQALAAVRQRLNEPAPKSAEQAVVDTARQQMNDAPKVRALQEYLNGLKANERLAKVASWFIDDPQGLQLARTPRNEKTIAANWAWRTYFHGGPDDRPRTWRLKATGEHIQETHVSALFLSDATFHWILTVSTPVYAADGGQFLGIVALTLEVGGEDFGLRVTEQGRSGEPQRFAALIDWRDNQNKGLIFQHPLLEKLDRLPQRFADYKVAADELPPDNVTDALTRRYHDPLASDPRGSSYTGGWLAVSAPIFMRDQDTGLRVIVQERHGAAIGPTLGQLQTSLVYIGLAALAGILAVWLFLWGLAAKAFNGNGTGHRSSRVAVAATGLAEPAATIPMRDETP